MRIMPNFADLDTLLGKMGLRPVAVSLPGTVSPPPRRPPILATLALTDVEFDQDGLFRIEGEPVFLYIHQARNPFATVEEAVVSPEKLRRFHLSECTTIQEMRAKNRFERFVATNKAEGPFRCFLTDEGGRSHEVWADLIVCQHCLRRLDWEGFERLAAEAKRMVAKEFTRIAFLEKYSPSFASLPSRRAETTVRPVYPGDWQEISRRVRAARNFRCEAPGCGVDCSSKPGLTDAHHLSGDVTDCRPENLRVLCKLCHAKEHPGWYRVRYREHRDLEELLQMQGIGAVL